MAPYSFAIARVLRKKALVICARSKKNFSVLIFYDVNMDKNSKADGEFSRIPFGEIP